MDSDRVKSPDIDHSLISDTRAFLVSAPKGVSINRFDKDYRSLFGKPFPYRSYGFSSAFQFLKVLEDKGVLRIERSHNPRDGGWIMHGIPDINNYLPSWFKKAHDKHCSSVSSHNTTGSALHESASGRSTGEAGGAIQPDIGGTYSLHIQWKSHGRIPESDGLIRTNISDLMSTVGRPIEIVSVPNKKYAFVRFSGVKEAENALKLNKKTINQFTFEIKPAIPLKYLKKAQTCNNTCTIPKRDPFPPLPLTSMKPSICALPHHNNIEDPLALSVDDDDSSSDLSESDWEDLVPSSIKHKSSINSFHWSTFVSKCSGGVSWTERLRKMCGEARTVKLIASDCCIQGCSHWLQVVDSQEMQCLHRLQRYAMTYIHSMPSTGLCSDNSGVFCYLKGEEVIRCLMLDINGVVNPRVFNIDTGEIVTVTIASLKIPPKWFEEFPMLAVPCYLQGHFSTKYYIGKAHILSTDSLVPLPLTVQLVDNDDGDNGPPPLINSSASPSPTYQTTSFLTPDLSTSSHYSPSIDDLQWRFNDVPNGNGLIAVHVSEVVSPALFWVQVTNDPSGDLQWMSDMINETHTAKPIDSNHVNVLIGNIYSYKNGSSYCRVKVESFNDYEKQQVATICIDSGVKLDCVSIHSLRTLSLTLTDQPPLAVPCCITRIVSTVEGTVWYALDNQLLWKTIRKKMVYVQYPYDDFTPSQWSSMRGGDPHQHIVSFNDVFLDSDGNASVANIMMEQGTFVAINKNV